LSCAQLHFISIYGNSLPYLEVRLNSFWYFSWLLIRASNRAPKTYRNWSENTISEHCGSQLIKSTGLLHDSERRTKLFVMYVLFPNFLAIVIQKHHFSHNCNWNNPWEQNQNSDQLQVAILEISKTFFSNSGGFQFWIICKSEILQFVIPRFEIPSHSHYVTLGAFSIRYGSLDIWGGRRGLDFLFIFIIFIFSILKNILGVVSNCQSFTSNLIYNVHIVQFIFYLHSNILKMPIRTLIRKPIYVWRHLRTMGRWTIRHLTVINSN